MTFIAIAVIIIILVGVIISADCDLEEWGIALFKWFLILVVFFALWYLADP